jgi:hypothetical protein
MMDVFGTIAKTVVGSGLEGLFGGGGKQNTAAQLQMKPKKHQGLMGVPGVTGTTTTAPSAASSVGQISSLMSKHENIMNSIKTPV